MNNKGEMNYVGLIIVVAITLVVGLILFQAIAQEAGKATNTETVANLSMASNPVAGTAQYITSYKAITGVVIFNATGDVAVPSSNYTVTNNVIDPVTGQLSVNVTPVVGLNNTWTGGAWQISGTGQTPTYISDSGARAITGLIAIFFALAVLVIALVPTLRNDFMDMIGK